MKIRKNICVNENLFSKSKEIFKRYGLTFDDAVNLFLANVVMENKIPFDPLLSKELEQRIKNVERGQNLEKHENIDALFEKQYLMLNEREWDKFEKMLNSPPQNNEELKKLLQLKLEDCYETH